MAEESIMDSDIRWKALYIKGKAVGRYIMLSNPKIALSWSYRQLGSGLCVIGTEPRSSVKTSMSLTAVTSPQFLTLLIIPIV